jgi:L-fucose isomerase-like protein
MNRGFLPVASDFISQKEINDIIRINSEFLKKLHCTQISSSDIRNVEQLYYFVITGGTEQQILDLHAKRSEAFHDEEIILLTHASHNSLPAALEVLARFQQDGKEGRIIYLPEITENLKNNQSPAIRKFDIKQKLAGKRIGLIGKPSDWLVASSSQIKIVESVFGVEVIPIDMEEVKQNFKEVEPEQIKKIALELTENSIEIKEPSQKEIEDNVRIYLAIKELIAKYNLDALTIRCFDLVLDMKTTGCFALSRLNDEGIIAVCEGDMVNTIGMMWGLEKYGTLSWMANPSRINLKENSLILAHCTVPCSLVKSYTLRSHFESGLGVGIQGEFPLQDVMLFRLGGKELDLIWKVEGKITQTGHAENLCRTQIKVKLDDEYSVQDLLLDPLGNHLIVVSK